MQDFARTLISFSLLGLVGGCGDSAPADDTPPPPANGYQLKTPMLTLDAGQERYLCYTVRLNEKQQVAVTKFDAFTTSVIHHYEVFQALVPEQDGLFECPGQGAVKMTWLPLFGGGVGAAGLTVPDGAGFKIPGNSQLLLQLHMLNASTTSSSSNVTINMTYADDAAKVTPAGIFALGSMNINLPAGSQGVKINSQCALPKKLNVFAVQPHMHKLGTKITMERGQDPASMQTIFKRDPWVFGAQPIEPFSMNLNSGDYVGTTCTFNNTTSKPVMYGESTLDEMCYFVLFYTPFDRLDGCID